MDYQEKMEHVGEGQLIKGETDPLGRSLRHQSKSEVAQSCPTLCDLIDCSLPGSSICGIFQARILEWVASKILTNKTGRVLRDGISW